MATRLVVTSYRADLTPTKIAVNWRVAYCDHARKSTPVIHSRLVIPFFGKDGESGPLCGWQARTLNDGARGPKYLTASGVQKSALLYGIHRSGGEDEVLVVTEGVTDVWRLGQNAVATLGKSASQAQLQQLVASFVGRPIIVAYDRDASRENSRLRGQLETARRLANDDAPVVELVLPSDCNDLGECSRVEAWAAVADALMAAGVERADLRNCLPSTARLDVLTDRSAPKADAAGDLGRAIAVAYSYGPRVGLGGTIVHADGRIRSVGDPPAWWPGHMESRPTVYLDARSSFRALFAAGRADLIPTENFDDLWTMRRLVGDVLPATAGVGEVTSAASARRQSDEDGLAARLGKVGVRQLYEQIERPLLPIVSRMIHVGLPVDRRALERFAEQSPTAKEARSLLDAIDPETGRIHADLDPLGTSTGRFACEKPNVLAVDRRLRGAIVAPKNHRLLVADYSQFELRVAAGLSGDERLLAEFAAGDDPYQLAAAHVLEKRLARVSRQERKAGKNAMLARINVASLAALQESWGAGGADAARRFLDYFAARYARLAAWMEVAAIRGHSGNVAVTWAGRRCISDHLMGARHYVNAVIQGSAADIFKLALLRLHAILGDEVELLLPLHDGVLMAIPKRAIATCVSEIHAAMTAPFAEFPTPFAVTCTVGQTWGAQTPYER